MLEKSWTYSSYGGFAASLDAKRINMKSADSEFCGDVPVLGSQTFAEKNNLKRCQLNSSSRYESDLAFLGNGLEDKGSNGLFSYGWPELEKFEDVDDMFRNCDSTFGLDIDDCDVFSWFSSSYTIEGSTDALTSSFDFPSCNPCGSDTKTEQQEVYGQSNNGMAVNESHKELTLSNRKRDSLKLDSDSHHIDAQSEIHSHISPSKYQKSSEGKRRDQSWGNGVSFIQFDKLRVDKLREAGESNQWLNPQHSFSSENHLTGNQSSNHVLPGSTTSTIKSEVNVVPTIPPRETSHASNQMQSAISFQDISFKNPTCSETKKKGKSHQRRSSKHTEKSNSLLQRAGSDKLCAKKSIPSGENEAKGQNEVDGSDIGFLGELDSSTKQDSSCMSSVLDEVSIDARSLKQLQHVMVQLDIRTKLRIRDGLYRLARSAAQRHNYVDPSSAKGVDNDAMDVLSSAGTIKCTGFIDIETDTNPIDRSIAHLLFHRPSDPSAASAPHDAVAVNSHTVVEPPNPFTADKPTSREETTLANEEPLNKEIGTP